MRQGYDKLIPRLKEMLPAVRLGHLGRAVAFIRRLRRLRAGVFLWALVLSRFGHRPGFEEARRWYQRLSGKLIAPRPFHIRFKSPAVVRYLERAFELAVAPWRAPVRARTRHPLAKWFPDVVLWDSTIMQVADELKRVFPGLRGVPAGLKVSLAASLYGLVPLFAQMVRATCNDMTLFPPLSLFHRGTLLLFDLGFVAYDRLRQIAEAGLTYVCRLRNNGNALIVGYRRAPACVRKALRRQPKGVWLRDLLPRGKRIATTWDLDVLLRPNEHRTRLVPARLVIKPGPGGAQRAYLTNLDGRLWTPSAVAELYRLRWQIELVFKELKQHLSLESLPSKDPYAVQALAWASLIALALSRAVAACICPVRELVGLQGVLRPALLTRGLRACIRILGRALVAPASEIPMLVGAFLDQVLSEAKSRQREREDSPRRLCGLLPCATAA
jgi:hypothetical protein